MKKAKLDRYDVATRNCASKYNGYDELDCTDCMPFGGSGTHELIRRNPNALFYLTDWQHEDVKFVLEYMKDHDTVETNIKVVLCCPECKSGNLGYVPMSKVLVKTRLCLDCQHEWEAS